MTIEELKNLAVGDLLCWTHMGEIFSFIICECLGVQKNSLFSRFECDYYNYHLMQIGASDIHRYTFCASGNITSWRVIPTTESAK